jgi:protein disulfide-isomerase A6
LFCVDNNNNNNNNTDHNQKQMYSRHFGISSLCATAIVLILASSVHVSAACDNEVIELNVETFDAVVGLEKPSFVMFYAPWCGHCKALKPDWEKLGIASDCSKALIGRIDCDDQSNAEICARYEIQGYPTLKYFGSGDSDGDDYESGRDLPSLTKFVAEELLAPMCSVGNESQCDDEQIALLTEYAKLSGSEVTEKLDEYERLLDKATEDLETLIQDLTQKYEEGLEMSKTIKTEVKKKKKLLKQFTKASEEKTEL